MARAIRYKSPAARVMDEAIELAIEGSSFYPEKAADEGRAIVLVAADGSTRTLLPEVARE